MKNFWQKPSKQALQVASNPKSRLTKWLMGSILLVLTTTGIAIPWALSSCQQVIETPIDQNEIMYEIKIGNILHKITYADFANRMENYQPRDNQHLIDLTNAFNAAMIKALYQEERDAFLAFQAIIKQRNQDLKLDQSIDPQSHGYDVSKDQKTIINEQTKALNQAKKSFQTKFGKTWSKQWLAELKTNPIYGFQNLSSNDLNQIEENAITYMSSQAMKQAAFARFEKATINESQWLQADLNWHPTKTITYQNDQNQTVKLSPNQVQTIMNQYLDLTTNSQSSLSQINKLAVLETKSYHPSFRNPFYLLKQILIPLEPQIIASFDIDIAMGATNLSPLNLKSETLIKLFQISEKPVNALVKPMQFAIISQINHWQGATNVNPLNQALDLQLLTNLNGDEGSNSGGSNSQPNPDQLSTREDETTKPQDPNQALGSSKIQFASDLLKAPDDQNLDSRWLNIVALGLKQNLFQASTHNPFTMWTNLLWTLDDQNNEVDFQNYQKWIPFWQAINGQKASLKIIKLVNLWKQSFRHNLQSGIIGINSNLIANYNQILSDLVNELEPSDLVFLAKLLRISFIDPDHYLDNVSGQGLNDDGSVKDYNLVSGYWSVYQLSPTTYLRLGEQKMQIFAINDVDLKQMMQSDLTKQLSESPLLYDLATIYEKINNEQIINQFLLTQNHYQLVYKYQLMKTLIKDLETVGDFDDQGLFLEQLNSEQKQIINQAFSDFQSANSQLVINDFQANQAKGLDQVSDHLLNLLEQNHYYEFKTVSQNQVNQLYWQNDHKNFQGGILGIEAIEKQFLNRYRKLIRY